MKPPDGKFWKQFCKGLNAPAVAAVVEALAESDFFLRLADGSLPWNPGDSFEPFKPGFFALAVRILELQGLVAPGPGCLEPTDRTRKLLPNLGAFRGARRRIAQINGFLSRDPTAFEACRRLAATAELSPPDGLPHTLAAAVLARLEATGTLGLAAGPLGLSAACEQAGERTSLAWIAPLFRTLGWCREKPPWNLTGIGEAAARLAYLCLFSSSYLPTFASAARLLRGEISRPNARPDIESHLHRRLDIQFSGEVYRRSPCRAALEELLLPVFDRTPLSDQPRAIVDTGSGDGTVLALIYQAIRSRTLRGRHLREHPLWLVGAEYNKEASETTQARLATEELPALTCFGDIGNPEGLANTLAELGFPPDQVLHLSKSIFHNRRFEQPAAVTDDTPPTEGVFVAPDGGFIPKPAVLSHLRQLLSRWGQVATPHGFILIESHLIPAHLVRQAPSYNLMTCVEAAHGFSHQLLIEADAHLITCQQAGLQPVGRIGRLDPQQLGATTMTIQHLRTHPA